METSRITRFAAALLCCDTLAFAAGAAAQTTGEVAVPLTDPSRPAVLTVNAFLGDIVVRGMSRTDVLVQSPQRGGNSNRRQTDTPPGMRRLTPSFGLVIEERNNEVTVESPCADLLRGDPPPAPKPNPQPNPEPRGSRPSATPELRQLRNQLERLPKLNDLRCAGGDEVDLRIEVPLKTRLKISTISGDIEVNAVDGVIEVNTVDGDVELTGVAGSVVTNSVAGDVTAVLTRVDAGAPMSFTSLSGEIDVTLPASVRANVKLRTLNGDMFTDFDLPAASAAPPAGVRQSDGRVRFEVERAVTGSLNGGGADIELRSFTGDIYLRRSK